MVVPIAGKPTGVHFQVNELGYPRRFHVWWTDGEDAEHTYEGLIRSVEYFGGVPEEVLVDDQESTVLIPSNTGHPRFNERFVELAGHYGFTPAAAGPTGPGPRARTSAWWAM